jgi:uncharacterized repeat protein (TIGR01451 family)
MSNPESDSVRFEALSRELLERGLSVRFQARGASMSPCIRDGEIVYVTAVIVSKLRKGDIVLVKSHDGFRVHRIIVADPARNIFITRGDCGQQDDPLVSGEQILGLVNAKEVKLGKKSVRTNLKGIGGRLLRSAARGQYLVEKVLRSMSLRSMILFCGWMAFFFASAISHASVAVDSVNNISGTLSAGTTTGTYTHTVGTGTNRLLVVVYEMNISNAPGSNITNITFNGTSLTQLGAANNSANTRRVEIWYELNPPSGTFSGTLVQDNTGAAKNVGAVVGIISFTGVDQTVPLGAFTSAGGTAGTYSQLSVSSVVNGMVLDGLATGGDQTITISGPQVSEWNVNNGGTSTTGYLEGSGSVRSGAPSVPLSETFSGTSDWEEAGVSINPSSADIGVTTSVGSAVFVGSNTTYTISVFNNGTSAANTVSLSDTLATGMTLVSATPSTGTCVTTANPITCSLGTLASGATDTVTVVETASAAGSYANTATVSDSGTPPDPNTGNNTYTAVATVQSLSCVTPPQGISGTNLSGVLNTYYPGSASVAAGATSITVGAATGAGSAIAAGNLLLVIQMQDATVNTSNTVAYGNGYTGQGFSALNSAGDYEFVTAQSAVSASGGTLTISGAGSGGGLVFAYHATPANEASAGQSAFQVIVVPQYTTASFSAASPPTALAWNGSTGGVLALDTSSTLTLNGATVSVNGQGFRGGAGMQLTGAGGASTDYRAVSPATYTGAAGGAAGWDGSKGEGVAGTPLWVESNSTFLKTNTNYPSGTAGTDGSMARGAPGNAGGGGTDGDPNGTNDQNAGGGGGGNGGAGGFGGDSWSTNLSTGGEGGAVFPATINRIALGGGGGAGSRNNSDGDNQASGGASGGGIIIIRTYGLSGTATLTANGTSAYNGTANDAGGGGGAGGTIVVLSANGGESGLTLQANGGNGGNAYASEAFSLGQRHGPGGGGGGGVLLVSGTPASSSVSGGVNGITDNPGVAYGATSGAAGFSVTNESITQTSGTQSGAQCTPDVTLSKSHSPTTLTRGSTVTYTIPVQNVSPYGASTGTVTVNDTLPTGLTPTSASGTGWTCSIASQTVSCTDSTVLAAGSFYPSITITASVSQTAPATETNIAVVGGGGEINLANDTYTDVASVVSSADLSVTNTASPNPVTAGNNITYSQVVTNNGPSAADNATFVEAIPANSTFVSLAYPTGWTCTTPGVGLTGNVVCTDLTLNGGTAATFSLVTKVNTGTSNGTVITDTDTVSSSTSDPVSTNNSASASVVVGTTSGAELTVTNSASPDPVVAGNNITYTQVVTNTGSAAATSATFQEATPANTTIVSVSAPAGWTCTSPPLAVSCTDTSVAAGATGTFSVIYKVNTGTASGTVITDIATVNASNQAFGANSASAADVVASSSTQADLALSTSSTPANALAGNDITYVQTVTNNGPGTASSVSFVEAVPTNTTFASISVPSGWSCTTPAVGATGNITCTDTSLASGASANIIIVVNTASTLAATTITANSSVTSSTTDPNSANNSTTVTTPVTTACDLSVTSSASPNPVAAASNITYTQIVSNTGPSNCSTATFTEAIPANTTFVSLSSVPAGWTCTTSGSISCTNPSVAPGSTSTFPVVVAVGSGTASGTIITDTATVGTSTRDTNTANNTVTTTVAVASAGQADLTVTNSASPNPVNAGSNITYTQTITNNGPATAGTAVVIVVDQPPANTTYVSQTGPAGWTCGAYSAPYYVCSIASLAANASATMTFVVNVNATATPGSTISDTDTVNQAYNTDPNPNNNSATATVVVAGSADLSVTNTASPVPVIAGNNISYTQVVTNAGPSAATSASFSETTPANTTFQSITPPAGWSCTTPAVGATGTITCTNATVAVGSASFTVALQVNAGTAAGTAINDTASVSSATSDPNSSNNTATAADVVATSTQADLITTNTASPTSVSAGSNVTYTQSVTNNGPAAATAPTFTQTTPPNTTFQSITAPAGWTCTTPAVGGTGTITCTDGSSLSLNATANFTLVTQVVSSTASGTTIPETDTASATNIVPSLTTNSATATVTVANANSANVTLVKSATPSPTVADGDPLTYTLAVTNNGPASATNVIVTDPLPSNVSYLQVTTTAGTCSEAGGTVTCLLGTLANAGTATITILTLAGAPGVATNTASVTADQMTAPNTSTQVETITAATVVRLISFAAQSGKDKMGAGRVILQWKTGTESHNLGFNVYREQNGERVQLNPSLVAGSALLMSGALPRHAGKTYSWIDSSPVADGGVYWLEDVDVNGTRSLHGPVSPLSPQSPPSSSLTDEPAPASSMMLSEINQSQPALSSRQQSHPVEHIAGTLSPTSSQRQKQFELASHPAVKISVDHEGWYCATQPQLIRSGLDPEVDPALLHLYAEAIEQPVEIVGAASGPGGFGPQAAVCFYGTAIDTLYSGTRIYWLVEEQSQGDRVARLPLGVGSNQPPASFPFSVEIVPHTTYFAALINPEGNNFFGPLVSTTALDQTLEVVHLDGGSTQSAHLQVVLQGIVLAFPHNVSIALNGTSLGDVSFTGQAKGKFEIDIPPGVLLEGTNTVTLTAQDGEYDTSLLQSIRITYPHTYAADSDTLTFTGRPGEELQVNGFTQTPISVLDITNPTSPVQLTATVTPASSPESYTIDFQVPWTTTNGANPTAHTLMAVAADRVQSPADLRPNHPSHWHSAQAGAEEVMISAEAFLPALEPIGRAHQAQGISSASISVDDLYDEFNFGEHSPYAILDFLQTAAKAWQVAPTYMLLNGRASLDPRNYLGFGYLDFVPTKIIPTSSLMTASDDWFSDFNDTGMPSIATGRLPVSTLAEAELVAGKIATYEGQSTNGPWTSQALMVADVNENDNFTQDSQMVQAALPPSIQPTDVFASNMSIPDAQAAILNGINSGQALVNYAGHGSEDEWSGDDLFNNTSANSLTNGTSLPVFLIMDCLNGFFQDVYEEPLAVTLMLAPDGGAVAVLASSGLNQAPQQIMLDKLVVRSAMRPPQATLGDAILKAKAGISDISVRRTYNLLGDPAMRIKPPAAASSR